MSAWAEPDPELLPLLPAGGDALLSGGGGGWRETGDEGRGRLGGGRGRRRVPSAAISQSRVVLLTTREARVPPSTRQSRSERAVHAPTVSVMRSVGVGGGWRVILGGADQPSCQPRPALLTTPPPLCQTRSVSALRHYGPPPPPPPERSRKEGWVCQRPYQPPVVPHWSMRWGTRAGSANNFTVRHFREFSCLWYFTTTIARADNRLC